MRARTATGKDLLSEGFRLDASYHANEGRVALRIIYSWQTLSPLSNRVDRIEDICIPGGIFIGGRAKRIYVDDIKHGIPFLSSSDMLMSYFDSVKLISQKQPELESLLLRKGWTLISRSGTIGNTAYVRQDMDGLAGSEHIMRVIANSQKISSGYLYAFLSSNISISLIRQGTYGAVVDTISPEYIGSLPIPRLGPDQEERIHHLIEKAAELRAHACKYIEQARQILISINNLAPLTPEDYYFYGNGKRSEDTTGTFFISSRELSSLTINAWNYADKFRNLRQRIMAGNFKPFSDVILPNGYYTGRSFKRVPMSPGRGIEFIGQKDLFGLRKVGKWISQVPIGSIETEIVDDGTILLAGVGTNAETEVFGRCEFVWRNFEGIIPAAEIIRIVANPQIIDPGYLYAFLSSDYGFRLLRSTITGTKLCRFIEPLVMSIPVPLPKNESDMSKIGDMVRQAYDNRAQALQLEDQAQCILGEALGINRV